MPNPISLRIFEVQRISTLKQRMFSRAFIQQTQCIFQTSPHLLFISHVFPPFKSNRLYSSSPSKEASAVKLYLSGRSDKKWTPSIFDKNPPFVALRCEVVVVKSGKCRSGSTPICLWSVSQLATPPLAPLIVTELYADAGQQVHSSPKALGLRVCHQFLLQTTLILTVVRRIFF